MYNERDYLTTLYKMTPDGLTCRYDQSIKQYRSGALVIVESFFCTITPWYTLTRNGNTC